MAEPREPRPLRVLVAHNAYQQRGGEDAVVEAEVALLRKHGHHVVEYRRHNDELEALSPWDAAAQTLWSRRSAHEVAALLQAQDIDLVHCHNTFPLVSPSIYWAADRVQVPVVQTLHNFRLLCPQATFLREGRVCEDCLGHLPWRAVAHACYRGSRAHSGAVVALLGLHRGLGSYRDKVTLYIALNEFCRRKFVEGGLPAERLRVKPNFIDRPEPPAPQTRSGFLYVGRLSPEKGVSVLAEAARRCPELALRVAGDGPQRALLHGVPGLAPLGLLGPERVFEEMARARALVLPSLCYESFPLTLVEACACGLPVIASRIGAMSELVEHGVTGLLVEPGDAGDLAAALRWAEAHPGPMEAMGRRARSLYERRLGPDTNHAQLQAIYREALSLRAAGRAPMRSPGP